MPKPPQNTSINKLKSLHDKPFSPNLSNPILNKSLNSGSQKMDSFIKSLFCYKNRLNTDDIKKILNQWIGKEYKPTHLFTVQLPENWKSNNADNSRSHLRMIMKIFEKSLLGKHWSKHHLPFIAFAENGTSDDWHYHILLNQSKFTEQELKNATLKTTIKLELPFYCLRIDRIDENVLTVNSYCTKEIKIYWNDKFDSDRIIFSECLFGL
jgi:hypothetical protein